MKNKYTGKNEAEAVAAACRDKNVTNEELHYEIVEEKTGIFGIGNKVTIEAYCLKDVIDFVKEYLKTYFDGLHMQVDITVSLENGRIKIMLNAENNAILIGHGGETLKAINTVTRNVTSSYFKRRYEISVDINNYKEERYEKVTAMAIRIAKNVARTKINATLDPMPSDERKVIHQALDGIKHVRTESIGERNQRRLQIIYDANKE